MDTKEDCPINKIGLNPQRTLYIPVKDVNGIKKDKYLRIVENGELHNQLLNSYPDLDFKYIHVIE